MPCRVFRYYINAYIDYLLSDAASEDSIAASAFISLVTHRIKFDPNEIRHAWDGIEPVLKKLAFEQDFYAADWAACGDFRTKMNEIVKQGFAVSFDTTGPEHVPDGLTIRDLVRMGAVPAAIAVPILVNSGRISGITCTSTRQQIITALGDPDCEGGGVILYVSRIPEWIRYDLSDPRLLFYCDDGQIDFVLVMGPWT